MIQRHTGAAAEMPAGSCTPIPKPRTRRLLFLLAIAAACSAPIDLRAQSAFVATPVRDFQQSRSSDVQMCRLVGLLSYSSIAQLDAEWMGHPRGTWLVWAAGVEPGTGACGFVRLVGQVALIRALLGFRKDLPFMQAPEPGRARDH